MGIAGKKRVAATIAVLVLAIAAVVRYSAPTWPRLAPGDRCILVGENIDGDETVCAPFGAGPLYLAPLGTLVTVVNDEGPLWKATRLVTVRLEREEILVHVERIDIQKMDLHRRNIQRNDPPDKNAPWRREATIGK
jgi:hypothetical protein